MAKVDSVESVDEHVTTKNPLKGKESAENNNVNII